LPTSPGSVSRNWRVSARYFYPKSPITFACRKLHSL